MSTVKGRNFSVTTNYNDYFGVAQFEKLSQRVYDRRHKSLRNVDKLSSVEDVYESMVKELKLTSNKALPHINKLVKKASGIMKLSQVQNPPRPATTPDFENFNYDDLFLDLDNRNYRTGEFSSHLEKHQSEIISKLAQNGGKFSEIWDEFEEATYSRNSSRPTITNYEPLESRSSLASKSTDATTTNSSRVASKRPSWKYFANHNVLSSTSITTSSTSTNRSRFLPSTKTSAKQMPHNRRPLTAQEPRSKSDYMKQVFVVKGQIVTFNFKANEFYNFKNWFGDDTVLKKCNGEFRRELDLSGFKSCEIRIKLHEGYKLVVEGYRPLRNGVPPLRHKSTVLLPAGVPVDKLYICRTPNGRLIIIQAG